MFPTIATIRAAKRDRVAGGQQQLHTDKVMSDCYNTKSQRSVMLANTAIRRVHNFTYLGSNASEDRGTRMDVETRIQKARGAFTRLGKILMAHCVN
jgi:hypothetical protein